VGRAIWAPTDGWVGRSGPAAWAGRFIQVTIHQQGRWFSQRACATTAFVRQGLAAGARPPLGHANGPGQCARPRPRQPAHQAAGAIGRPSRATPPPAPPAPRCHRRYVAWPCNTLPVAIVAKPGRVASRRRREHAVQFGRVDRPTPVPLALGRADLVGPDGAKDRAFVQTGSSRGLRQARVHALHPHCAALRPPRKATVPRQWLRRR